MHSNVRSVEIIICPGVASFVALREEWKTVHEAAFCVSCVTQLFFATDLAHFRKQFYHPELSQEACMQFYEKRRPHETMAGDKTRDAVHHSEGTEFFICSLLGVLLLAPK